MTSATTLASRLIVCGFSVFRGIGMLSLFSTLFLLAAMGLEAAPIPVGTSHYVLENDGEPIDIFAYKPPTYSAGPIFVIVHGSSRNAEDYRNFAINLAERFEALVVAPLFDEKRFNDERYKRGCGVTKNGVLQPKDKWTFAVIPKLVADVRQKEKGENLPYYVIGHSGGAQFATKMAMFYPDKAVRFIAANPGSNVFPDKSIKFPYGLGGLPDELSNDDILRQYCAAPLTLFLGTGDVYQNASDGFDFSAEAMHQGPVRLARNHNFYNLMKKLAHEHGWAFNWRIVETPDIGHSGSRMFRAPEIEDAIFGPGKRSKKNDSRADEPPHP